MADLAELLARVEKAEESRELDEAVAKAFGWRRNRRGRLGLSGRTAGRYEWQPPGAYAWKARPPHFTGVRMRQYAAALLKALIAQAKAPQSSEEQPLGAEGTDAVTHPGIPQEDGPA